MKLREWDLGGEPLVILLWVVAPPKGECEHSHKIRDASEKGPTTTATTSTKSTTASSTNTKIRVPRRAHKAQWASGARPQLSRQENNRDTLDDRSLSATMGNHNGNRWKDLNSLKTTQPHRISSQVSILSTLTPDSM